eukprot:m.213224 g.213224  ORF g.213224 m.213224 type:complete len:68 (+) comp23797_c0_seq1:107-310(+)
MRRSHGRSLVVVHREKHENGMNLYRNIITHIMKTLSLVPVLVLLVLPLLLLPVQVQQRRVQPSCVAQ